MYIALNNIRPRRLLAQKVKGQNGMFVYTKLF